MFDSGPGVHDQVFQRYISMLEGLIVNRWSAAEHLPENKKIRLDGREFLQKKKTHPQAGVNIENYL